MNRACCLIFPPLSRAERQSSLVGGFGQAAPLGILWVGAVLRKLGWDVVIVDCRNHPDLDNEALARFILTQAAEVYAFSSTTNSIVETFDLASRIRAQTDGPIILGGAHVTALPVQTLDACPAINFGVVGEGESTTAELFTALASGAPTDRIPGIVRREGDQIVLHPRREFIKNLDELPYPAWDLLPDLATHYRPSLFSYRALPATHLVTSRGCTGACTFCDTSIFGRRYRQFSPDYIIGMIRHLHERFGIRDIYFDDDSFVVNKKRLLTLCSLIRDLSFRLEWSCNARVDLVDEETLKVMAESGCWQISYGVESGSQRILDDMRKGITLEQIERAMRLTRAAGIRIKGFFIFGYPTETAETMRQTIDFALKLPLDVFQPSIFTPYPNTEAARLLGQDIDWARANMFKSEYNLPDLSASLVDSIYQQAIRRFYFRPSVFLRVLKDCTSWYLLKKYIISMRMFLKTIRG